MTEWKQTYIFAGVGMISAGAFLSPLAYVVLDSVPMTALGICLLILGSVLLLLGRSFSAISPELGKLFFETAKENLGALVEELGATSQAIYLPSSIAGGCPKALVPLRSNHTAPLLRDALPKRLIVWYGTDHRDIGILTSTLGSVALRQFQPVADPSPVGLETALSSILVGRLDVASKVTVSFEGQVVRVELSNPWRDSQDSRFHNIWGGALASIVASIVAEARGYPVSIRSETNERGRQAIELEVHSENS